MVDLRKETQGENSTKGLDLVVIAYDNRVHKNKETGEVLNHYLDVRLHPEDRRAPGQTTLALVSKKDAKSPNGYNNSAPYASKQFEAIVEAAGDNKTPLTNQTGEVLGTIYGVKADVFINKGLVIANTKTLEPSTFSVQNDAAGKDIRTRMFDSMKEASQARDAAKAAAAAEAPAPEAGVEAPAPAEAVAEAQNDEPGLG